MKKSELKLGDWVLAGGSPIKIDELVEGIDALSVYDDETNEIKDYSYDDLTPIPLTEEILEKSGWRKSGYMSVRGRATLYRLGSATDRDRTVVCFYAQDIFLEMWQEHNIVRKEIKYVHQLQHILWALGVDDDLKI